MDLKSIKVSEKKQEILHRMKIDSVEDLLVHYPFRYEENIQKPFNQFEVGEKVCFEATILTVARVNRYGYKKSSTKFSVLYDEEEILITLFNRPWTSAFTIGKKITIFGKYEGNYKVTCSSYNMKDIKEQLGIIPVYNVKDKLTQNDLRKYLLNALKDTTFHDLIPKDYQQKYHLIHKNEAMHEIHNPSNKENLKQSLRYLKYEEFLKFQLQMQYMKSLNNEMSGVSKSFSISKIEELIASLPFSLTKGQKDAINDILNDLKSNHVMYRLVQGDVGCGKTLVAAMGLYASVLSNYQCAFMAPTEILAKQHAQNLMELFKDTPVRIAMLSSSIKKKERIQLLADLKAHKIDILIGTHALFQKDVIYAKLGMIVTDEQHRFGVNQRRQLLEKGDKVDFLLMSATPIPRTLAVSIFGDMDVSSIVELPKNRKEIQTKYINEDSMKSILMDILTKIDGGNQVYIVCPAIEANEEYAMRNVIDLYTSMNQVLGKKYKLSLLHGKMSSTEKDQVMETFLNHESDILVATTVIEVGVDVKNANIMVIYDAHRFGMSQIHQLRGRVGRGSEQGYCYLLSASKDADSIKRLKLIEQCSDGFEISKQDLAMRGSGDLLGIRQSGISSFILGDIVNDFSILESARTDALEILNHLADYPEIIAFLHEKELSDYLD